MNQKNSKEQFFIYADRLMGYNKHLETSFVNFVKLLKRPTSSKAAMTNVRM